MTHVFFLLFGNKLTCLLQSADSKPLSYGKFRHSMTSAMHFDNVNSKTEILFVLYVHFTMWINPCNIFNLLAQNFRQSNRIILAM